MWLKQCITRQITPCSRAALMTNAWGARSRSTPHTFSGFLGNAITPGILLTVAAWLGINAAFIDCVWRGGITGCRDAADA
ncbi:MAG: hypothetical protein ACR5LF_03320 [Symbiopectobacterium sp.]